MKIAFLLVAVFFLNEAIFSQWPGNEDPLSIKELRLTRLQQKKIRRINKDAATEINFLEKNGSKNEAITTRIDKIKGARIKKIRNCLTQEQQVAWREKLMENKPRRGVTDSPNERTVQ